jgi:Tol biopolymer transport system component
MGALTVIGVSGGMPRILYNPGSGLTLSGPAWSPDSRNILFTEQVQLLLRDPLPSEPAIADVETGRVRRVIPDCPAQFCFVDGGATWSPDGARIAFTRLLPDERSPEKTSASIEVMNADGTGLRAVFQCAGQGCDISAGPRWSPDGATIAFATYGAAAIHLVAAAGGPEHDVRACANEICLIRHFVWSPDGRSLALVDEAQAPNLYVVGVDGHGRRMVGTNFECCLIWLPD